MRTVFAWIAASALTERRRIKVAILNSEELSSLNLTNAEIEQLFTRRELFVLA